MSIEVSLSPMAQPGPQMRAPSRGPRAFKNPPGKSRHANVKDFTSLAKESCELIIRSREHRDFPAGIAEKFQIFYSSGIGQLRDADAPRMAACHTRTHACSL